MTVFDTSTERHLDDVSAPNFGGRVFSVADRPLSPVGTIYLAHLSVHLCYAYVVGTPGWNGLKLPSRWVWGLSMRPLLANVTSGDSQ
jgi:hypothetical protein